MNKNSLPAYLMTSEPGSFAHYTVLERYPNIINQVIEGNRYPQNIVNALRELQTEIRSGGKATPLSADFPNSQDWNTLLVSYENDTWLGLMWYFSEAFFYQRILDVVQYYREGELKGLDPYRGLKQSQISGDIADLCAVWPQYENLPALERFDLILHSCLWGNRADLSMTAFIDGQSLQGLSNQSEREFIVSDATDVARDYLSRGHNQVDVLNDNAGADSIFDLVLADFLISQGWVKTVRFLLKDCPFFISDAMPKDIRQTISELQAQNNNAVCALGRRLDNYLVSGQLILSTHPFFSSGHTFEDLPADVVADLQKADLIILKGDANYRRMLGERHWPYGTPIEEAAHFFPQSFLAMRTIKCELLAGLESEKAREMEKLNRDDMFAFVSGKRGVIQMRLNSSK
ncbi:MAG: protein-glutamate O-methyltransferase family protein [Anaerolineae bacterium]|nr:protein-glutamate O-methyltransferase family protein [Anaerolineae bacterium]